MVDDLTGPQIASFLDEHVREMLSITPPESKHALDLETLREPGITFWSVMDGGTVVGCGALKRLDARHAEVKSMRTLAVRQRHPGTTPGRVLTAWLPRSCCWSCMEEATMSYRRAAVGTGLEPRETEGDGWR